MNFFSNIFEKKYKLEDLNDITKLIIPVRDNYRIVFIDDQKFNIVELMKTHGFRVDYLKDVNRIDELEKYHIIVSDIQGVGKKFGSTFEGGHLIKEIRLHYPLKYLIAFSGMSFDVRFNDFFKLCDNVMQKQSDATEWSSCLDESIKQLTNPIYNWQKAREQLLKNNIEIEVVTKLEQSYVKSLLKRDKKLFDAISSSKQINYPNAVATIDAIGTYIQVALGILQMAK